MNGKTHMIVGGLSAGIPVAISISLKELGFDIGNCIYFPIVGVIPAIFGGIAPDVDMPYSIAGKWVRKALTAVITGSGFMLVFLYVMLMLGSKTYKVLLPFFCFFLLACFLTLFITAAKHRRETHSGLLFLVLTLPLFWCCTFSSVNIVTDILFSAWFGFIIGWLSHLVIDSFNRKGVPWLYPFITKHYSVMSVTTGTKEEDFFRLVSIISFICFYFLIFILLGIVL